MCYCYLHIFPNEKIYVGTTQQEKVEMRWKKGGSGYRTQSLMWNAICKYGWENIKHQVIVCKTPEEMWEMEKELIKEYDTTNPAKGYNLSTGGEVGSIGFHHTEKTKIKISNSKKGKPLSEEHKQKLRDVESGERHPNYGKHLSEETKQKISKSHKGKIISASTRQKMRERGLLRRHTEEEKRKIGLAHKGIPRTKSKWLTPQGEIREMCIAHVKQHHPDWILIQNKE